MAGSYGVRISSRNSEPTMHIMQILNALRQYRIYCTIDRQNPFKIHGKINMKPFEIEVDEYPDPDVAGNPRCKFVKISTHQDHRFLRVEPQIDFEAFKRIFIELFPGVEIVQWLTELLQARFPGWFLDSNGMIFGIFNGNRVVIYESTDDFGMDMECLQVKNLDTNQKLTAFEFGESVATHQGLFDKLVRALETVTKGGFQSRVINFNWPPFLDQSKRPPPGFWNQHWQEEEGDI